jgi:predicted nucleic acid-binding protein
MDQYTATMLETPWVFVDTNVFIQYNFNFSEQSSLGILGDYAEDGVLHLVLTDITEREVRRNLRQRVDDSRQAVNAFRDDAGVLKNLHDPRFGMLVGPKPNYDEINQQLLAQWTTYLQRTAVTVVPVDGSRTTEVFERYFGGLPPFGGKGKKDEFPDAFALLTLEEWLLKENGPRGRMYVISADGPVREYCANHAQFVPVEKLKDLLVLSALQVENQAKIVALQHWLEQEPPGLELRIRKAFALLGFSLDQFDGDVEWVTPLEVNVDDAHIIAVDETEANAVLTATISFNAEVSYPDPAGMHYDRETGETHNFYENLQRSLRRETQLEFEVQFRHPTTLGAEVAIDVIGIQALADQDVLVALEEDEY